MLPRSRLSQFVACFLAFGLLPLLGCGEQPQIRSYEVPRDEAATTGEAEASSTEPTRMIAAVVLRESEAWFVKATGSAEQMAEADEALREFIASIELPDDAPNRIAWQMPDDWTDGGDRAMREATLIIPGDEPVEVAISKLSYDGDQQEYLLANINRWRGQLGLAPAEKLDESAGVTQVELDGGTAWVLDAEGQMSTSGAMPPMMGGGGPFASGSGAPPMTQQPPTATTGKPMLEVNAPDDWQELPRGSMGSRSYQVGSGDEAVVVKMSDFPPVGMMADPLANINRWRGQLGQPPLDKESLAGETEAIEIAGSEGVLTDIRSPDKSQAMLAAMVTKHNQVWFFQMLGSGSGVDAHRSEFTDWLGTVDIVLPAAGEAAE